MGLVYSEPACQAAYGGDLQQLYGILKENPTLIDVQDQHTGDTPLIAACRNGNLNVTKYLLNNKANTQLTNKKQRTCLHYVSKRTLSLLDYLMISILMPILLLGYFLLLQKQRKSVELMEAVLSSNVNIDAIDYKGNTALHYVCQRKSHRLVPLLLKRNAKTDVRNKDGETPLDIAIRLQFTKIVNMLRKEN
ncbi:PREDICTED: ankyrin repeat domain-containing protein 22 [Cyprinodon variegatus]|uniref:Ankyrin repeat domain 22 n=1 Tax=Cyprinodon variegatus TaxID=28743 RepID=A0A3Q2DC03_CYPVA|nr:PREDICTED: ankyrin repeat domain-containing protein 22 [Cyprinodon variegatus]